MSSAWVLHERLAADTLPVRDLALSRLLVMRDARFAWAILVPRVPDLTELHRLPAADRDQLMREVTAVASALAGLPGVTKINHGALGNLVPQFHWHVVARHPGDAAWPGPVWGSGAAVPPEPEALEQLVAALAAVDPD